MHVYICVVCSYHLLFPKTLPFYVHLGTQGQIFISSYDHIFDVKFRNSDLNSNPNKRIDSHARDFL